MTDPLTMAALGSVALTEGIKFLYGQAGELLKRWRERKSHAEPPTEQPITITLPKAVFAGSLAPVTIRYDVVARLEDQVKELSRDLGQYADGFEEVQVGDPLLLEKVNTLRLALEAAFGQRMTFLGEDRPATGTPVVVGEAFVKEVEGHVAAVRARIVAGDVRGTARADHVHKGGEVYGVEADVIGPQPSLPPQSPPPSD
jgi:hypothetical protein